MSNNNKLLTFKLCSDKRSRKPPSEAPAIEGPVSEAAAIEAPETEAPETEAQETEAPETEAPETDAPETAVAETEDPETEASETEAPETDMSHVNATIVSDRRSAMHYGVTQVVDSNVSGCSSSTSISTSICQDSTTYKHFS